LIQEIKHVVARLSWNENGWIGPPSEADRRSSGYASVRDGWDGNESWNFNRSANVQDDYKYGSFERAETMQSFTNGASIIFFCSRHPKKEQTLFVGLWAMAERVEDPRGIDSKDHVQNIRVSSHVPGLIQKFDTYFPYIPARHLLISEGRHHAKLGQSVFCYINQQGAYNILFDAIHSGNDKINPIVNLYNFELKTISV
jgi:hypothetical protein